MAPVYYCLGQPSNTISSGALKFYVSFQKVTFKPLEHCDFFDPQGGYWRSPYHTQNNSDYIQIEIVKSKPQRNRNILFLTFWYLSKQNLSQLIHQNFGHVYIDRLKLISRKLLLEGLPTNIPDLEEPCHNCLLKKESKIPRGPTIDFSTFSHGFMLQMDFAFFNVEIICGFTSTFVSICSATS